ncbi:MAG: 60S ribosomal export protein NMD3 [Methanomicrobiales archaeon]
MDIKTSICPRCGAPSVGLCPRCRAAEIDWLQCDPVAYLVRCPSCGSIRSEGAWMEPPEERDELVRDAVLRAVSFHRDVDPREIIIEEIPVSPNRSHCTVRVTALLYGVEVEDACTLDLEIRGEQCDRCSRLSGGYYEGVVQLRATDRPTTPYERDAAARIAEDLEESLQESGERLSFVSQIDEIHDGLDITVGSRHLGMEIAREIRQRLGGVITTHPTLVGERDGRPIYRVTFLVRLPFHQRGDVVEAGGRYLEVRDAGVDAVRVEDLGDRSTRTIREEEIDRTLGNVRDAVDAMVAYHDRATMGLLDPWSFETVEVPIPSWLAVREGGSVRVLRDERESVLVPVG